MSKKAAKRAKKETTGRKGSKLERRDESAGQEEASSESKSGKASGFPIVGVGASAGGLEALKELFSHLPGDTNMGFVVVTHQHPGHTSMLAELLGEATSIPVTEAVEGAVVEANHVYVAQPGGLLAIMERKLHRLEALSEEAKRLPIDSFLRSLAEDQHERAICVILSGTGTDGTLGLKAIKGGSGMAMVQEAESAQYAGMPSSAAATGLADYVLAPAAMAKQLLAYATGPYLRSPERPAVPHEPLHRIYQQLRNRTGHDFSGYKSTTIRRRIERRMNVHGIEQPSEYLSFLQDNPHEIDILFKELLISVTNFFRDPGAYEELGKLLFELLKSWPDSYTIRVWVPGCATGEECFSLAMLLREGMIKAQRHFEVQIFGTDLDADAVESARAAVYPDGIASDVSPERLERFFTREETGWRIRKEIREMCVFAPHNIIKDAPFTKVDLVSCRNLLIYLSAELQTKILPVFHYALKPGGLLFLGPSESIGNLTDLYNSLSNKWKIFRRREPVGPRVLPELPLVAPVVASEPVERGRVLGKPAAKGLSQIERLLLNWYCPASLVVNERGDIIHIHGRTGAFLEPAQGQPRLNVMEMAREGLHLELSHALRQAARRDNHEVVRENVRVRSNGDTIYADLAVTRIKEPEALRGLFVITFRAVPPPESGPEKKPVFVEADRVEGMERELQYAKESLQSTIEELETSNEELKSTNEELQSTNEELQSSNEELETSKEEMQSLNEELTTVNAELQSKVEALAQTSDDMQNLLNSTDIATIFLDNNLNIKRYTEQAKKIVKLIPTDVGRPIGDLVSKLEYEDLEEDCRSVFQSLNTLEIEVPTESEELYLMRVAPYRTSENIIDGLVITFVDISEVHRAARKVHSFFEGVVHTVREPLVMLDGEFRVRGCNPAFGRLFEPSSLGLEGRLLFEICGGVWNVTALRTLLSEVLKTNDSFEELRIEVGITEEDRRNFVLNARQLELTGEQGMKRRRKGRRIRESASGSCAIERT